MSDANNVSLGTLTAAQVKAWKDDPTVQNAIKPDGIRKIGSTRNLPLRLRDLRRSYDSKYLAEKTWPIAGGRANWIESKVHRALAAYRVDIDSGSQEHYRVSLEMIDRTIKHSILTDKRWKLDQMKALQTLMKGTDDEQA